jgi:hypothetical protein
MASGTLARSAQAATLGIVLPVLLMAYLSGLDALGHGLWHHRSRGVRWCGAAVGSGGECGEPRLGHDRVAGAALAPGNAGLYQMAVQVPPAAPDGDLAVVAQVNGVGSPSGVLLNVRR